MKNINVIFEDWQFEKLKKIKKNRTWKQVLLDLIEDPPNHE